MQRHLKSMTGAAAWMTLTTLFVAGCQTDGDGTSTGGSSGVVGTPDAAGPPDAALPQPMDAGGTPDAAGPADAAQPPDAAVEPEDAGAPVDAGPLTTAQLARQYYLSNVWPTLAAQNCSVCHSGNTTASLNFLGGSATANAEVSYFTLRSWFAQRAPRAGWPLVNTTDPANSVVLLQGAHASGAAPAFGRNVVDLQKFILWAQRERARQEEDGTYVPQLVDAGTPEPPDAGAPDSSVPDAAVADAGPGNPLPPDAGTTVYMDPFGGMIHHNLTPALTPDDVVDLLSQEGPPEYALRIHGCSKFTYGALGTVLRALGLPQASSAMTLYTSKPEVMGALAYAAGKRESLQLTTAGAAKFFDIALEAAPLLVANLPAQPACADPAGMGGSTNGQARLFNDTACGAGLSGCCLESGFTCLMGIPATPDHLVLCDEVVRQTLNNDGSSSVDPTLGKALAVGTLMAGTFICE
jgi:hypothetical protein